MWPHRCDTVRLRGFWRVGIAQNAMFSFQSYAALPAWTVSSSPKNGRARRIGCSRCRQILHRACARERFGSQNRKLALSDDFQTEGRKSCTGHAATRERFGSQNRSKLACSDDFFNFRSAKFAPRCGASAIWKSKPLEPSTRVSDHLLKFKSCRATGARISTNHPYKKLDGWKITDKQAGHGGLAPPNEGSSRDFGFEPNGNSRLKTNSRLSLSSRRFLARIAQRIIIFRPQF